ncbi:MAG: hypothetical protein ACHQT8_04245 [Chlamydiales bacterium]
MKKKQFAMCICLLIACSLFLTREIVAEIYAPQTIECQETQHAHGLTFLVSTNDLRVEGDGVFADVNGVLFRVHSLEKVGQLWLVRPVAAAYCPRGHPTCNACGQCHTEGCWYFVRYCKLWN